LETFFKGVFDLNPEEIEAVVILLNQGKSYKEVAKELNMSVDQVKRRFYAARNMVQPAEKPSQTYQLGGDAKDRKILMQADEIARLRKEIKEQHRENIDAERINDILGTISNAIVEPPKWIVSAPKKDKDQEVLMTSWADWHAGEVVLKSELKGINEYNMTVM
jgi:transposase-like protein